MQVGEILVTYTTIGIQPGIGIMYMLGICLASITVNDHHSILSSSQLVSMHPSVKQAFVHLRVM